MKNTEKALNPASTQQFSFWQLLWDGISDITGFFGFLPHFLFLIDDILGYSPQSRAKMRIAVRQAALLTNRRGMVCFRTQIA